jgi:hypothetical protein
MPNLGARPAGRPVRLRNLVLRRSSDPIALLLGQALPAQAAIAGWRLVLALVCPARSVWPTIGSSAGAWPRPLLAPDVVQAFLTDGPVALYRLRVGGASSQAAVLPGWEMIESEEDLLHVASVLRPTQRAGWRSDKMSRMAPRSARRWFMRRRHWQPAQTVQSRQSTCRATA